MLSFEYPAWMLLLCLAAGLLTALVLYYRDRTFRENAPRLPWLLGLLRTLAVAGIAALLLGPLLRYIEERVQPPVVVVAQDVSESVGTALGADTTAYRRDYEGMLAALGEKYEVVEYTFGDRVAQDGALDFGEKRTNLSDVISQVADQYGNQNLGAFILASDGIYNAGTNPVYASNQLNAPVFTVGLGDTTLRRDLAIRRVFNNKIAYLNDEFSIQVDLGARNAAGANTTLTVSRVDGGDSRELTRESIRIEDNDFFTTREFVLPADRSGVQRYRIAVSGIGQEESTSNNRRDIFVDVLDARKKILVLGHAPHPDLGALRQALNEGENNEVDVAYAGTFSGNPRDYDLVVLHQLPSAANPISGLLQQLQEQRKPLLYIVGEQTNIRVLNERQNLLTIRAGGAGNNDVQARLSPAFRLFNLSDELRSFLPKLPPLQAPFGEFTAGAGGSVLFSQRIGRVDTEYPLLILGESGGIRTGVLAGTGLWQWRLADFLEHEDHQRFNELMSQLTQYLSVKEDKRRFRVAQEKNIFDENEAVQLDAELYNENYELVNEPDATVVITDEEGKEYDFTFNRTSRAYTLNAGLLPVGNYRYRAGTSTGTETLTYDGRFSVSAVEIEGYVTTADHNLLRQITGRYGGEFLTRAELTSIPERLDARGTVKPVQYQTATTRSLINLKWIFFLLLFFLSMEWFLRRFYGAY